MIVYELWMFGHVWWWVEHNPDSTAFMDDAAHAPARQRIPRRQLRHQWVPYERISAHLKRAIVAAEDAKFLDHEGFDWEAIQKAHEKNLKHGRDRRGRFDHLASSSRRTCSSPAAARPGARRRKR